MIESRFADHELIKAQAVRNAKTLVLGRYPKATVQGNSIRWSLDGIKGTGCSVRLSDGVFTPFSGGGESTDIIGFLVWAKGADPKNKDERLAVFDELRKQGYGNGGVTPAPEVMEDVKRERTERETKLHDEQEAARDEAFERFRKTFDIVGTPAGLYYTNRCGEDELNAPCCLRYDPAMPLSSKPGAGTHQALVMALKGESGFLGLHSIFITDAGLKAFSGHRSKRNTKTPTKGGAMRFGEARATLYVCEGPEKAWALLRILEPGNAVWAVPGADYLTSLEVPEHVRRVVIMADHDELKTPDTGEPFRPGQQAAEKLASRMVDQGRQVQIVYPPHENVDWDDMALQAGDEGFEQLRADILKMIAEAEVWRPEPVTQPEPPAQSAVEEMVEPEAPPVGAYDPIGDSEQREADSDGFKTSAASAGPQSSADPLDNRMPPGTEWELKDVLDWMGAADNPDFHGSDAAARKHKVKRRHVYVRAKKSFLEIGARSLKQMMDKEQFADRFARFCASADVAKHPRKWAQMLLAELDTIQVDDVTYRPGRKRFIWEYDGRFCINLWSPSPVIPLEDVEDHAEPFFGLVRAQTYGLTKAEQQPTYQRHRTWMAYVTQNPGRPPLWWPAFVGDQGTGKTTILEVFCQVLQGVDAHVYSLGVVMPSITVLDKDFNAILAQKEFIGFDEAAGSAEGKAHQRSARAKKLSDRSLVIERKGVDAGTEANQAAIALATNTPYGVPCEFNDRRWDITECSKKDPRVRAALKAYHDWLDKHTPRRHARGEGEEHQNRRRPRHRVHQVGAAARR